MPLPKDPAKRKEFPIARGVLDYFPDAIAEVAHVSKVGNDQHNPGQPMHWAKEKSTDHADCIVRHLIDRGKRDSDGVRHSAKVAWRALALLQIELEEECKKTSTSKQSTVRSLCLHQKKGAGRSHGGSKRRKGGSSTRSRRGS